MSERKVLRSGAAAVACLPTVSKHRAKMSSAEFPQIDTTGGIRQSDPSGLSSIQIGKMDTPRVATRNGAQHCGVSQPFVAKVRRSLSLSGTKMDTPRVATRNGAEHCGVHHDTVAAQRAKASTGEIPQSTIRTGADDRKIAEHCGVSPTTVGTIRRGGSTIQIGKSVTPAETLRTGADDRKIAEHCGVDHKTVAAQRAKMSGSEIPNLNDEPRLGRDGATP
jgi:hypothetical protein